MPYSITIKPEGECCVKGDILHVGFELADCYSVGLSIAQTQELECAWERGGLASQLDGVPWEKYLFILIEKRTRKVIVCNDKFGTNQIFFAANRTGCIISSDIRTAAKFTGKVGRYNLEAAREVFYFCTVLPPHTIIQDVMTVPLGSYATVDVRQNGSGVVRFSRYWDIERRLANKQASYKQLVGAVQEALTCNVRKYVGPRTAVSLSGGIDSGGLLGIASEFSATTPDSISVGARGPDTEDLYYARQTVRELSTNNYEIYPTRAVLNRLPQYVEGLAQPIAGDYLIGHSLVFEQASMMGVRKMLNGSGVQMLLGNLMINRFAFYFGWIDPLVPPDLYSGVSHMLGLSVNKEKFLRSKTWVKRYLCAVAPRISDEYDYFLHTHDDFVSRASVKIEKQISKVPSDTLDYITQMYVLGSFNYQQYRDMTAVAQKYNVDPVVPFDSPAVAENMFRASNRHRKKGRWKKQLVRDVLKPYISERLYQATPRSLIVPYDKLFQGDHEKYIAYLRTSPLVSDMIDVDKFAHTYSTVPEPGISLVRLLCLALWYDSNWNSGNLSEYPVLDVD